MSTSSLNDLYRYYVNEDGKIYLDKIVDDLGQDSYHRYESVVLVDTSGGLVRGCGDTFNNDDYFIRNRLIGVLYG